MSARDNDRNLGVDLLFRPDADASHWARVFAAIAAWQPQLAPFEWLDATDPDQVRHPWSAQAAQDLFTACSAHKVLARIVEPDSATAGAVTVRVRKPDVMMLVNLPRPDAPLDKLLIDLLERLQPRDQPAVAMLFDLDSDHDAEVIFQGLSGLQQATPYMFFDAAAADAIGRERIRSAPCTVRDVPGGGLLLVARPDPWARTAPEIRRMRTVARHLGISSATPLVPT